MQKQQPVRIFDSLSDFQPNLSVVLFVLSALLSLALRALLLVLSVALVLLISVLIVLLILVVLHFNLRSPPTGIFRNRESAEYGLPKIFDNEHLCNTHASHSKNVILFLELHLKYASKKASLCAKLF